MHIRRPALYYDTFFMGTCADFLTAPMYVSMYICMYVCTEISYASNHKTRELFEIILFSRYFVYGCF